MAAVRADGDAYAELAGIVRSLLNLPDGGLDRQTRYRDIPGWDSLSHINVVFRIEQTFGFRFSDEELDRLRDFETLGELADLIAAKLRDQAAA